MIREFDISPEYCCGPAPVSPPTADMVACAARNGYRRAWVGASYSNQQVVEAYFATLDALERPAGVYAFVHWDDSWEWHLTNGLRHVLKDRRRSILLDVELGDPWSMDPAAVESRIWECVNYCRARGVEPIIYTAPWWWVPATGDSQQTFGCMAVVAEYIHDADNPPPIEDVKPCGGWSFAAGNMYAWQYAGTVPTCEMNTDRILVVKDADMAFDAQKRATQEAALRQLAGDALADNMDSLVARLELFGVVPPGTKSAVHNLVTETGA